MRVAPPVQLSADVEARLRAQARARSLPARLVQRSEIVLRAAAGEQDKAIAAAMGIGAQKVGRWRKRFLRLGAEGLVKDAPRPGRRKKFTHARVAAVVRKTTQEKPAHATHWSTRTMAAATGMSKVTIGRIWAAHGLKPHRVASFKLSNDPAFAEKLEAIVGLYLDPPEHAMVLCCDEKSQIQALDRTQPGLPMKKGRAATMTHDYKRNGTTALFAALETVEGRVIGICQQRHRHQEWIKFLRFIDLSTPPDRELHLILDNYVTHKHPRVQRWLARHPRFHLHFTPTSASWLNMVERFFRDLTQNRLRRGVFASAADLVDAIHAYVDHHNQAPKPFIWTASANDILAKVTRGRRAFDNVQSV